MSARIDQDRARARPRLGPLRVATPWPLALAAVVLAVASCMPAPATEQAQAVATLWTQFLIAAGLVGGTVWILITVMLIRYRRRSGDDGTAATGRSDWLRLELVWTAIPIAIVLVLFGLTLAALNVVDARVPSKVTVDVTAFRWQWRFDYPGTPVSVIGGPNVDAVMVVPAGEPIHIVLTSADVNHAFYVPAFLFKRDAIAGHPNEFDVTITDPGDYRGQCAEFCGVYHDQMLLTVRAVTRPDFDAWLASQAGAASPGPSSGPSPAPSSSTSP